MTVAAIKSEILKTYPPWKGEPNSMDGDKYSETYEVHIRELIAAYCEAQGYLFEGFPSEKRVLGRTDFDYDDDYFTWERYEKYIDMLCLEKDDVLELRLFYYNTFWPDEVTSEKEIIENIKFNLKNNLYDTEF